MYSACSSLPRADRGDLAVEMSEAFPLFFGRMLEGFPGSAHIDVGRPLSGDRVMSGGEPSGVLRDIGTLFSSGTLGGLSDGHLLERFVNWKE
jgi:hypothetical protein